MSQWVWHRRLWPTPQPEQRMLAGPGPAAAGLVSHTLLLWEAVRRQWLEGDPG